MTNLKEMQDVPFDWVEMLLRHGAEIRQLSFSVGRMKLAAVGLLRQYVDNPEEVLEGAIAKEKQRMDEQLKSKAGE